MDRHQLPEKFGTTVEYILGGVLCDFVSRWLIHDQV